MKYLFLFSILLSLNCPFGISQRDEIDSVYTPKGSRVYAWRTIEEESSLRDTLDNANSRAYPENTYIITYDGKSSTRRFNCHGYAWYMVGSGLGLTDPRWIGYNYSTEEDIYMTDGSYIQVLSEMYPGKVSWGGVGSDHSAITTSQTGVFISKWSFGPLVEHAYDNSPFGTTDLKYYVSTDISGSTELLCHSTSRNFSVVNIPNASYSWTVGSGLSKTENGNSITVTANYGFSGQTYVEVTITSPLGNYQYDIKTSKKVYFMIGGVPSAPTVYPSGDPPIEMGIYSYKDIVVTNYPGAATWSSSGAVQTIWSDGQTGRFYSTEEGNAYFYVTTYNVCGSSSMYQGSIKVLDDMMDSIEPGNEDTFWSTSPNPCKSYFDLTFTTADEKFFNNPFTIEIFDSYSRMKQINKLIGINNRIVLNNFTPGSYFIRLILNGKVYQKY